VRVLKQDFHTEKIPIILFSSRPDEELAPIAEQAGADGYLSKSHGIDKLGDLIDDLVESIIW
jgi:CheY-like chemotaxis protein